MSRDDAIKVPDQPDGITDDSRALPDAARAVRRVRAYVTGAGDGLYDTSNPGDGPRPLYGRDLEAICREVERLTALVDSANWCDCGIGASRHGLCDNSAIATQPHADNCPARDRVLARWYADLRTRVMHHWPLVVEEVESADLREDRAKGGITRG